MKTIALLLIATVVSAFAGFGATFVVLFSRARSP
jgi:hypothetical protein